MDLYNTKDTKFFELDNQCIPNFGTKSTLSTASIESLNSNDPGSISIKQKVSSAVVIFCDLSNFQRLTEKYGDMMCASVVEALFAHFDEIATSSQLTPLKTNGDQYIVVGFLTKNEVADEALHLCATNAVEFAVKARDLVSRNSLLVSMPCQLRVGIATGALISGSSNRSPAGFDIWGTTVNKAAMLEQFTAPSTIAICENTHRVFVAPAGKSDIPITHSNATFWQQNIKALPSDNKQTDESVPASHCIKALRFYKTLIHTKSTCLNAYIC
ncbi:adenylate/guanylate cyclase domain-containing protein [Alteromonas marina]|uniref:adenylate/guanylate cyclase domain-containing protein n=1 Tax=Alteromonas marina TaxID=203795 RepID=UPI000689E300|nr:adenylate/guanylate cyclase domain-containing protein [Alteromonas marina]